MRTLVVEDSLIIRLVLKRLLAPYGESVEAKHGLEAVAAFSKAVEEKNPYDLVCLDLQVPELDGAGVLRRIRHTEQEIRLPRAAKILVITASSDENTVRNVVALGADGFLIKPVDSRKLRESLENLGLVPSECGAGTS